MDSNLFEKQRIACLGVEHSGEFIGVRRGEHHEWIGLPVTPIQTEAPTPEDMRRTLAPYASIVYSPTCQAVKVAEMDGEWDRRPARIIVFLLRGLFLQNQFVQSSVMVHPDFNPELGTFDVTIELLRKARRELASAA